jgi:hypothetical protein
VAKKEKPLNQVERYFIDRINRCKLGLPSHHAEGKNEEVFDRLIELGYIDVDKYGRFKTIGSYPDDLF